MPKCHPFLFQPGVWSGSGQIVLNMVEEALSFTTQWIVHPKDVLGKILGSQKIQIQGLSDEMLNELCFYDIKGKGFSVDFSNANIGRVVGLGIFDETSVGWEFTNNDLGFEGFETYLLQSDGTYLMHAEYLTSEQFRTQIQARLSLESNEVSSYDTEGESEGCEEDS
jgi:hypothetical protein